MTRRGPKQPSQRQRRVGELIRHALAGIFMREDLRDPDLADVSVTVTAVEMSPDLRLARAFITPLGGVDPAPVVAGLNRCAPYLRRCLAGEVSLKYLPQLMFAADLSFDRAQRIERLLHRVRER